MLSSNDRRGRIEHFRGSVKLYFYSKTLNAFLPMKQLITKCAIAGIVTGILLLGAVRLNQFVSRGIESRSAEKLMMENQILKAQLDLISPRINDMELKTQDMNERVTAFRTLLYRHGIVGDTSWRFTDATRGPRSRSEVSAASIF
jgi:hypothetical protein